MIPIPANELLAGMCTARPVMIHAVVTDSRQAGPGCVFVCFPGARVDGHDFAAAAVKAGAEYVVANHPIPGVPEEKTVLCPNSGHAMVRMAGHYRSLFSPLMIGVTGSVGKTTTKEFCYAVLSAFGNTLKTEGNQNNEIGMPNTLFRLETATEYAVVEMGMSARGEIERLSRAARPNAGIITMIGVSHIENLGSRENILKAKLELCTGLPMGAPLALNADDDLLPTAALPQKIRPVWFGVHAPQADVRAVDIVQGAQGQDFTLVDAEHGRFAVHIPTLGLHTVYDALAAYAAATRLGLDPARCAKALANYQTTGMRQNVVKRGDITVVEDCYNASPDSMKAALNVLKTLPARHRVALLGDMLELGEVAAQAHADVGRWAAEAGVDHLIAYGPLSETMAKAAKECGIVADHCTSAEDAVQLLCTALAPGDALLAKASHSMALEKILAAYYQRLQKGE